MTVLNIETASKGAIFEMEGGGKVELKLLTTDDFEEIRKKVEKKKVEYKRVDGKAERFEFVEVNNDLQIEMFWDMAIVSWENLFDSKGQEIPCTKENKLLLMNRSAVFNNFVTESLKALRESEASLQEQIEKN